MRRNNQAAAAEDEAQIDLTPMLDVVFIMLIFFIVTASFIKEAGIEVNRPEASTSQPKENVNILIAINANNEIWMDKRRIDVRAVRANIERLHAENPKGAVVIQADNKSNTETVAAVLDASREAGVFDVSLATEDE
jgi:biopolymer transport protein ExbD